MNFFQSGFVILLLLTSNILAVDNSFKLDFDGDGATDIALYREGSRAPDVAPQMSVWYYLNTRTGQMGAVGWGRTLDVPTPADYDGDGKTDVAVWRWWDFVIGDTSEWWVYKSSGGSLTLTYEFEPSYNKFSRNYIGDGRAEIAQLYQTNFSQDPNQPCFLSNYIIGDEQGNIIRKTVGDVCNQVPTPVPGDYNNDGRSEIAVFSNQTFKVWTPPYSSGYTTPNIVQTLNVDAPAPGDYDGDGKTDFAGVKRQNGRLLWRIKLSYFDVVAEIDYGLASDIPVPGDYDGDGRTDLAVFRRSNGSWWIRNSSTENIYLFYFGLSTDTPLAAPVIPFNPI
jgi:spore coat protein A, manganese oxidase